MISIATKQANKSCYRYKVGAIIVKGGRLLATGYNVVGKTNPNHQTFPESVHAEEAAILSRIKTKDGLASLQGATIYVSRVTSKGSPGLAKPCINCERLIRAVGIKKVVYTTNDGQTEVYKL